MPFQPQFGEHLENIWRTFREYLENIQKVTFLTFILKKYDEFLKQENSFIRYIYDDYFQQYINIHDN